MKESIASAQRKCGRETAEAAYSMGEAKLRTARILPRALGKRSKQERSRENSTDTCRHQKEGGVANV